MSKHTSDEDINITKHIFFNENHISKQIIKHYGGLSSHLLRSCNYFLQEGLKRSIREGFIIDSPVSFVDMTKHRARHVFIRLTFDNVKLAKPSFYEKNHRYDMLPSHAIKKRMTYGSTLTLSAVIDIMVDNSSVKQHKIADLFIGTVPIMCGSVLCNAKNIDRRYWNDENIPFECMSGMHIIEGHSYYMVTKKDMMIGKYYTSVYSRKKDNAMVMHKYNVKSQILSSSNPENIRSTQIELRAETDKGDVPTLLCEWKVEYFDSVQVPFYVIFYLLGVITDYDIVNYIVKLYPTKTERAIFDVLQSLLSAPNQLHGHVTEYEMWVHLHHYLIENQRSTIYLHRSKLIQHLTLDDVKENVNSKLLAQMGTTPADIENKRIFYGHIVRDLLLKYVALRGVTQEAKAKAIGESDRVETINVSFTQAHDTQRRMLNHALHQSFVSYARKGIENIAKTVPDLDSLINADFASIFAKYKTIDNKSSEIFSSKMRAITPPVSKLDTNKRLRNYLQKVDSNKSGYNNYEKSSAFIAFDKYHNISKSGLTDNLQKPPPSGFGVAFGNMSTPESEPGKRQGIPMTVTFTIPSSRRDVDNIKVRLKEHPDVVLLSELTSGDRQGLTYYHVFVNNSMYAITTNPHQLRRDLIEQKRDNAIYRDTSIFIDTYSRSLRINTISGRGKSFCFIVYNNIDEFLAGKTDKFHQWLKYDKVKDHNKDISTLIREKKIEATFSDDCTDQFIAISQNVFKQHEHDETTQFTHVEIESNLLAITTANIPFVGNMPGNRATFGGCHQLGCADRSLPQLSGTKKNMSQKALNFSLISRLPQEVTYPNISLPIVAMAPHISAQEDGLTVNKFPVTMGYMSSDYFDHKTALLTSGYNLQKPSPNETSGMHADWNYSKLNSTGIVAEGTYVTEGDVLMGITRSNADIETGKSYTDESVVYRGPNEALVLMTSYDKHARDGGYISVLLIKDMPLRVGDKTATITANKAVVSSIVDDDELFSNSNGMSPTVLINPEAIINRDLFNTPYMMLLSLIALYDGCFYDGFGFKNPLVILEQPSAKHKLKSIADTETGLTLVYDNTTGDPIDYYMMAPMDQLRIQKNGETEMYAVGNAKINRRTQQPDSGGRNSGGSHRLSRMDMQAYNGHGVTIISEDNQTDRIEEVVCGKCNREAVYNIREEIYYCGVCNSSNNVYYIDSSFAIHDTRSKMLVGGNINVSPIIQPPLEVAGTLEENGKVKLF